MRQNFVIVFIALVFALDTSTAQSAYFSSVTRYSAEDGLPATTVFTMAKDESGYLWLGTPSGLVRFDGYDFQVYNPSNTDNKNLILSGAGNIFLDSQKRIWIGSWGNGAAVYNRDLDLLFQFQQDQTNPNALQSNMVQTFFEDKDGAIWLGTNGGGLARFNEETGDFTNFLHDPNNANSLSHNRIWGIAQQKDGTYWIATSEGLNRLDYPSQSEIKRFQHKPNTPHSIDHPLTRAILVDAEDRIWLGTETGFGQLDEQTEKFHKKSPSPGKVMSAITRLKLGQDNHIWVGTQKGLYRFIPELDTFSELARNEDFALLPNDDIRDIHISENNAIWVATRYAGLSRIEFSPSLFKGYTQYQDIDNRIYQLPIVYSIFEDRGGKVWLGTSEGLLQWHPEGVHRPLVKGINDTSDVWDIAEDKEGRLWLGTEAGISYLGPERNERIDRSELLENYENVAVTNVFIDSSDRIWMATNHEGVVLFDHHSVRHYKHQKNDVDGLMSNSITDIFEDQLNRMWFSANGQGVNRLDADQDIFYKYDNQRNEADSLYSPNVSDIFQSKDGTMWFGSNLSLDKLDEVTDRFSHFNEMDGMANGNVKAIMEDDFGNLWISTDYGISQYKREQQYFVNYNTSDGLHGDHFFVRSAYKSENHGLLFGGVKGLTQIRGEPTTNNVRRPTPQITGMWIDGNKSKRFSFSNGEPLHINHGVNNIEIHFSALDFTDPENNQFQYWLEGYDKNWLAPTKTNQTNYAGLKPGKYTFRLKASNNTNLWSDSELTLQIQIHAPWWQLLWVRVLAGIIVLLSIVALFRYRTTALRRQRAKLEKEVNLRTKDLFSAQKQLIESEKNAALSGLVAGVAHEINTPLGISVTAASNLMERSSLLIKSMDQKAVKRSELLAHAQNIRESAEMVMTNLSRASDLVRSFKEVSVDQISQQRRQFNFKNYLEEIINSLMPRLKKENVTVTTRCPENINLDSYPGAIAQLITNLAINAVVHAFDERGHGHIEIDIERRKDNIYLRFSDDGKGITEDNLERIFEPFFTTKRGQGGSGLGLQIISNIVNFRLGGQITCESTVGKGTCFHIQFLAHPE